MARLHCCAGQSGPMNSVKPASLRHLGSASLTTSTVYLKSATVAHLSICKRKQLNMTKNFQDQTHNTGAARFNLCLTFISRELHWHNYFGDFCQPNTVAFYDGQCRSSCLLSQIRCQSSNLLGNTAGHFYSVPHCMETFITRMNDILRYSWEINSNNPDRRCWQNEVWTGSD